MLTSGVEFAARQVCCASGTRRPAHGLRTVERILALVDAWKRGLPVGVYHGNARGKSRAPFAAG
eukprot:4090550-Alexandrium_andersonii.AAC.1